MLRQFENLGRIVNWSKILKHECVLSESSPLLAHMLKLLLDKTKILEMSFLWAKKNSPLQRSVTAQAGTYLAKSKQIRHTRFFSSWQSLANKPALHNITNILVITGSNISNSVALWSVWSADASRGSFPFRSLPLSPQSSVHYRVIPGFALLHNWRKRSVLLAAVKRTEPSGFTEAAHTGIWRNVVMNYPPSTGILIINEYETQLLLAGSYIQSWLVLSSKTNF